MMSQPSEPRFLSQPSQPDGATFESKKRLPRCVEAAITSVSSFFARSPLNALYEIVNSKVAKGAAMVAMAGMSLGAQFVNPAAALEANGAEGVNTAKQITTEQVQNIAPGLTAAVESLSTPETQGIVNLDTTNPQDILTKLTAEHLYQSEVQARGGEEALSVSQQQEIYSRVSKIATELQPNLQALLDNEDSNLVLSDITNGEELNQKEFAFLRTYLNTLVDATSDNANLEQLHDAVEVASAQLETLNSETAGEENGTSTEGSFERGGVIGNLITSIGDGINDVKYRVWPSYLTIGNALKLVGLAGGISMTAFGVVGLWKENQKTIVRKYSSSDHEEPSSDESQIETDRESPAIPILNLVEKRALVDYFQPAIEDQDNEYPLIALFDKLQAEDQDVIFEIFDHLHSFDPTYKSILGIYGDKDISKDSNRLIDLLDPDELATLEGMIHVLITQYSQDLDESNNRDIDHSNRGEVDGFETLELDNLPDFETLDIFTKQRLVLKFNEAQSLGDYVDIFTTLSDDYKRPMLDDCINYYKTDKCHYNISSTVDQPDTVDVADFLVLNYDEILSLDRARFDEPELKLISLVIKNSIGRYKSDVNEARTLPKQPQTDVKKPLNGAEYADFKNRILLSFADLFEDSISGKTYLDIFASLDSNDRPRLINDMLEIYYQVYKKDPEYFQINQELIPLVQFLIQNRETLENANTGAIESLLDVVTKANLNVLIEMLIAKYRDDKSLYSLTDDAVETQQSRSIGTIKRNPVDLDAARDNGMNDALFHNEIQELEPPVGDEFKFIRNEIYAEDLKQRLTLEEASAVLEFFNRKDTDSHPRELLTYMDEDNLSSLLTRTSLLFAGNNQLMSIVDHVLYNLGTNNSWYTRINKVSIDILEDGINHYLEFLREILSSRESEKLSQPMDIKTPGNLDSEPQPQQNANGVKIPVYAFDASTDPDSVGNGAQEKEVQVASKGSEVYTQGAGTNETETLSPEQTPSKPSVTFSVESSDSQPQIIQREEELPNNPRISQFTSYYQFGEINDIQNSGPQFIDPYRIFPTDSSINEGNEFPNMLSISDGVSPTLGQNESLPRSNSTDNIRETALSNESNSSPVMGWVKLDHEQIKKGSFTTLPLKVQIVTITLESQSKKVELQKNNLSLPLTLPEDRVYIRNVRYKLNDVIADTELYIKKVGNEFLFSFTDPNLVQENLSERISDDPASDLGTPSNPQISKLESTSNESQSETESKFGYEALSGKLTQQFDIYGWSTESNMQYLKAWAYSLERLDNAESGHVLSQLPSIVYDNTKIFELVVKSLGILQSANIDLNDHTNWYHHLDDNHVMALGYAVMKYAAPRANHNYLISEIQAFQPYIIQPSARNNSTADFAQNNTASIDSIRIGEPGGGALAVQSRIPATIDSQRLDPQVQEPLAESTLVESDSSGYEPNDTKMTYDQFLKSQPYNELIRYLANAGLGLDDAALSALKSDYYNWFIQGSEETFDNQLKLFFKEYTHELQDIPEFLMIIGRFLIEATIRARRGVNVQRKLNDFIDSVEELKEYFNENRIFANYNTKEGDQIIQHLTKTIELLEYSVHDRNHYTKIIEHLESVKKILKTYQSIFNSINSEGELVDASSETELSDTIAALQ